MKFKNSLFILFCYLLQLLNNHKFTKQQKTIQIDSSKTKIRQHRSLFFHYKNSFIRVNKLFSHMGSIFRLKLIIKNDYPQKLLLHQRIDSDILVWITCFFLEKQRIFKFSFLYLYYSTMSKSVGFWIGFGLVLHPRLLSFNIHSIFIHSPYNCHIS